MALVWGFPDQCALSEPSVSSRRMCQELQNVLVKEAGLDWNPLIYTKIDIFSEFIFIQRNLQFHVFTVHS